MPAPTVNKIRTKLYLPSFKRATHVLEGEYAALTRGRSMDFDDLREYTVGDEIKDIDWKASSRSLTPLVKRYNSNRKHPVTFLVDTGRSMEAITNSNEVKKTLASEVVGILGYIAINHSDTLGFFYGDASKTNRLPYKETETHLNRALSAIWNSTTIASDVTNLTNLLHYGAKGLKQRGITIIVTSEVNLSEADSTYLKRILATQEVFWVTISDANPLEFSVNDRNTVIQDIETLDIIPDFIRNNKEMRNIFNQRESTRVSGFNSYLAKLNVNHVDISTSDSVIPSLIQLLERSARGRK